MTVFRGRDPLLYDATGKKDPTLKDPNCVYQLLKKR